MGFMRAMNGRIIRPEILDDLPLAQKRRSLEDLTLLNRQSGRRPLRRLLKRVVRPDDEFTILDIGAASGDMGRYMRELYPGARVASLDYRPDHLMLAPPPRIVADAFRLPFEPRSYDFVFSSLFLHHFSNEAVVELLSEMARVATRGVLALDLHRHPIAYYFVPATRWLYRWDPVTVHDAPISVEAAFRPAELEALAVEAGMIQPEVRSHGWSFRVSLFGRVK
jgi:2-polyprenyl-3-methyl-5-hydroxy-6-metoxy-1,4-benzoquinol methylase